MQRSLKDISWSRAWCRAMTTATVSVTVMKTAPPMATDGTAVRYRTVPTLRWQTQPVLSSPGKRCAASFAREPAQTNASSTSPKCQRLSGSPSTPSSMARCGLAGLLREERRLRSWLWLVRSGETYPLLSASRIEPSRLWMRRARRRAQPPSAQMTSSGKRLASVMLGTSESAALARLGCAGATRAWGLYTLATREPCDPLYLPGGWRRARAMDWAAGSGPSIYIPWSGPDGSPSEPSDTPWDGFFLDDDSVAVQCQVVHNTIIAPYQNRPAPARTFATVRLVSDLQCGGACDDNLRCTSWAWEPSTSSCILREGGRPTERGPEAVFGFRSGLLLQCSTSCNPFAGVGALRGDQASLYWGANVSTLLSNSSCTNSAKGGTPACRRFRAHGPVWKGLVLNRSDGTEIIWDMPETSTEPVRWQGLTTSTPRVTSLGTLRDGTLAAPSCIKLQGWFCQPLATRCARYCTFVPVQT